MSDDDWGVQSLPERSIWVPLPFSKGEPGSLGKVANTKKVQGKKIMGLIGRNLVNSRFARFIFCGRNHHIQTGALRITGWG